MGRFAGAALADLALNRKIENDLPHPVVHDGERNGRPRSVIRLAELLDEWAHRVSGVLSIVESRSGGRSDESIEDPMFVTVIHRIHDPEGFQAAEAKALEAGLPTSVALPVHAATHDHKLGICIWEGASVPAVREVVEGAVGPFADNEYFEMDVDGLTPQLGK